MKPPRIAEKLVPTLYEDDHLLAVAKPAGIDAGPQRSGTAVNLANMLGELRGRGESLHVANSLSRYESGVLLLAKDPVMAGHIRKELRAHRVALEYVAVVLGRMKQPQLMIDPIHGQSRGQRSEPKRQSKRPKQGAVRVRSGAADRQTMVRAVQAGRKRTLVKCKTMVENTHVLRAQLRAVRLRLLGDRLHDSTPGRQEPSSTCLHLARIRFYHPGKKSQVSITCREPPALATVAQDGRDIERPALAALVRRLPCLANRDTDSYRLLTGSVENVRGLIAEKFGKIVILQIVEEVPNLADSLAALARWYQKTLGVEAVYTKRLVDGRGAVETAPTGSGPRRPLVEKAVESEIEIGERGVRYVIRPHEAASVGLFLDQRENRSRIRSMAADKDVLNLFAYTCGFSVAAAAGGANSTVSVDLSPPCLEWGRANFAANHLDLTNHEFIKSDAGDYIKRAQRQDRQFDIVILDPPSFAHGRKRKQSFSIVKDLPELVAGASSLLRPEGTMMVSTNYRRLTLRGLRELIREGAGRRRFKVTATPPLPVDFAMDPDHAKTVFVQFA